MKTFWQRCVISIIGGGRQLGRHYLLLHDDGVLYARDMVIRWEWKI